MESVCQTLAGGELILGDGAVGTLLQARGLPPGAAPEVWNEGNPDEIVAVHCAYVQAGAQYVTTNSFGGSRIRLSEIGLGHRVFETNRLAAELARQAAAGRAWVAGSIGPTGRLLEPFGDLSIAEAEDVFAEQIAGLLAGGVDLFVVETQHDLQEAGAALRMARQQTNLPVFCTFAFDSRGRTMMGLRAAQAASQMEAWGADAVGANCGEGTQAVAVALEQMRGVTKLPLVARANAGIPHLGDDARAVWDVHPDEFAGQSCRFVELGARIVGGCCGSNPEYIVAMANALARHH